MDKKAFEQLTFRDDFIFCKVLQTNPDLCKELLELILDMPVGELVQVESQHPIEITADGRGVRFDVYAKDDNATIYDIEMQNAIGKGLPRRTRYAQSMIDLEAMERGFRYPKLPKSYIIFICSFDLFPEVGRHKYTFQNLCTEDPTIRLQDGTEKIFLCTEGTTDDISEELKQFLAYVSDNKQEGKLTEKLEQAVNIVKRNPRWREDRMFLEDYVEAAREEGIEKGREQGREEERLLTQKEKKRADDAEKKLAKALREIEELRKKN